VRTSSQSSRAWIYPCSCCCKQTAGHAEDTVCVCCQVCQVKANFHPLVDTVVQKIVNTLSRIRKDKVNSRTKHYCDIPATSATIFHTQLLDVGQTVQLFQSNCASDNVTNEASELTGNAQCDCAILSFGPSSSQNRCSASCVVSPLSFRHPVEPGSSREAMDMYGSDLSTAG
jgi:hypothetical protein